MTKNKTAETVGKKAAKKTLPDAGAEAETLENTTPNAVANSAQASGGARAARLKKTAITNDTALLVEGGATPNATSSVGSPTTKLKEQFSAQKIPLQTNFADLIDVADCGRKAVGLSPGQLGGTGAGLQLDGEDRLAVLVKNDGGIEASPSIAVKTQKDKGLMVDISGMAVIAGPGIKVDSAGVSVDIPTVLPSGMIIMFYKTVIPQGWVLCDGNNNTPDLRDRFVLGGSIQDNGTFYQKVSGPANAKNYQVTTNSVTPPVSISVRDWTLTEAQIPSHRHMGGVQLSNVSGVPNVTHYGYNVEINQTKGTISTNECDWNRDESRLAYTSNAGGNQGHAHSASGSQSSHSHVANIVPPYCILVFIMKL